ncbi:MAG: NAD(P)H-quinone oxidoreductase [Sphingobacteriaceae bacterium]
MKAIVITRPGDPAVLRQQERPQPVPVFGEVLVKVAAAGVNRPDIFQRKGNYPAPKGASIDIPGLEIAGTVAAAGPESRWKKGDKVCALLNGGGYAEYCTVPEGQCLPMPENVTFEEAASLPETFFTVWSNVFDRGQLKSGERFLVHGGTSGIGVAAIQLAKIFGASVYTTAGSDEKCRFCEQLGADKAINYKTSNFKEIIQSVTNGQGVNLILDMIGGNYTPDHLEILAPDGRLVLINTMKGNQVNMDLSKIMQKRLVITGSTLRARDASFKAAIARKLEEKVWSLISSGKIKPVVFKTFPFYNAANAHQLMESSAHMGKIVLMF